MVNFTGVALKNLRIWKTLQSRIRPLFPDQRGLMITMAAVSMTAVVGFAG